MHRPEREAKGHIEHLAGYLQFTFPKDDRPPALSRFNLYTALNLIDALIQYIKDCGGVFDGMDYGQDFLDEFRENKRARKCVDCSKRIKKGTGRGHGGHICPECYEVRVEYWKKQKGVA